jgi:hypothetical protein
LPQFPARRASAFAESVLAVGEPGTIDAQGVTQSVPFVQAAFIGTLAAALLAGIAMLISHS